METVRILSDFLANAIRFLQSSKAATLLEL